MKELGLFIRVATSNLGQLARKLLGVKISYRGMSLISPQASFRTFGSGKINYGKKIEIRPNTEITARNGEIVFGDNCFVNRNCMIVSHDSIKIGDNVTIGPGTVIYDHDHDGKGDFITMPISIESGVWIGANVVILKGVKVGKNAVIGAGSIITKDVCAETIVYQRKEEIIMKKRGGGV